jgi:hypothetical protein
MMSIYLYYEKVYYYHYYYNMCSRMKEELCDIFKKAGAMYIIIIITLF